MRVVLGTSGFAHPGGSESYVLLMAEQLERLGHDVTVRAVDRGALSEAAEARGVRVGTPGEEPDAAPDAILTQDAPTAYELVELWPEVPQVFRACSDVFDNGFAGRFLRRNFMRDLSRAVVQADQIWRSCNLSLPTAMTACVRFVTFSAFRIAVTCILTVPSATSSSRQISLLHLLQNLWVRKATY